MPDIVAELRWRELIHQTTDNANLQAWLNEKPRTIYVGFDPDLRQHARGKSRGRHAAPPLPAGRTSAHRAGGRGDGHDRRPQRQERRAQPLERRGPPRQCRQHGKTVAAVPRFRLRPQLGPAGEQLRLDGPLRLPRIPPRHRQAFSRQRHAGQRFGQGAAGTDRLRPELYRVQLHAAAGLRFRLPQRTLRLRVAGRRERPMGQHHGRNRPGPADPRRAAPRHHLPAVDEVRRHEDGQDRVRGPLALGRKDQPLQVLSILVQHPGRRRRQVPAVLHGPRPGGDRAVGEPARRQPRPAGRAEAAGRRSHAPGPRRRRGWPRP